MRVVGIVLAAGAGRRFGGPKALVRDAAGAPWLSRAVSTLTAAGCVRVIVVLGAAHRQAAALVPPGAHSVVAEDWSEGIAASVRAGLAAAEDMPDRVSAALIVPVDTPELPAEACRRVLAVGVEGNVLAQARYEGAPGHPVVIGRDHWQAVASHVRGDRGAGAYLRTHGAIRVECGDLWHGRDIDVPGTSSDVRAVRNGASGAQHDVLGLFAAEQVLDLTGDEPRHPRGHRR